MSDSSVTGQDIRAAAEVHGELGPEYGDAVVESFLARIDKQIEARVDERLAAVARPRRPVDPARLSKFRLAFGGLVAGSAVAGIPLTVLAAQARNEAGNSPKALLVIWVVVLAVYGLVAYRLRRR
ncbi:MAG: hypothetical protein WAK71_17410 [Streptosporangiaceae bacterium]